LPFKLHAPPNSTFADRTVYRKNVFEDSIYFCIPVPAPPLGFTFLPPSQHIKISSGAAEELGEVKLLPDGVNMKIYAVYRIGYWNNKLELIGKVVERRKEERKNNAADMLRWAQKIYAASSIDSSIFIVKEGSSEGPIFGGA
jgi:hypothetical protein